jgi:hypothetical protein
LLKADSGLAADAIAFIRKFAWMANVMRKLFAACCLLTCAGFASASPIVIDELVDSHTNLFYSSWGHWFTQDSDGALHAPASVAARAVQFGGSSFNFSDYYSLNIQASGSVVAHFETNTGPDGCENATACTFKDGFFRKLPVYNLIGIWSKSATEIIPFGDWKDINSGLGLLSIGSGRSLAIPKSPFSYLFLAVNDGGFADNSGEFRVHIAATPEPGYLSMLLGGVLLLGAFSHRQRAESRA